MKVPILRLLLVMVILAFTFLFATVHKVFLRYKSLSRKLA